LLYVHCTIFLLQRGKIPIIALSSKERRGRQEFYRGHLGRPTFAEDGPKKGGLSGGPAMAKDKEEGVR
jgi:hypothetical protein